MSTRMFSEEQLEQLASFPDIGRDDLIRKGFLAGEFAFGVHFRRESGR